MKLLGLCVACLFLLTTVSVAADFTFDFEWGDIPLCATGSPNTVPNPAFVLSGVPEGTKIISFRLTDLDVPSYDHGGGTLEYTGQAEVAPGAFTYKSPCPPSGSHRYEWTAYAKNKKGMFAKTLGKSKALKEYP